MDLETFRSLSEDSEDFKKLPASLKALWHDSKGNWAKAHQYVAEGNTSEDAWVHAYLHRKEGDKSNARYWYRIAGKDISKLDLESEWESITISLL